MLSIRVHNPQSGMVRKGRYNAVLSPVKLSGDILLHDENGIFALVKAETCVKCEGEAHRDAGVQSVEKASVYGTYPYLATIKMLQQFAADNKPLAADVAFMVRKGKSWADITPRMATVKALCREQSKGADPELAAVAKAAHGLIEGIAPADTCADKPLDLLTDTLADLTADEPLQPHVEKMAEHMARVQVTRRAYGVLKHVDPVALLKLDGECGFFAHVPHLSGKGRESLLVNMVKLDGYNEPRIYGRVTQGEGVFCEKITDEYAGKVAPEQAEAFKDAKDFYFIPLAIEKHFAVPVRFLRHKVRKPFACESEMAEVIKAELATLSPDDMAALTTPEMQALLRKLADATVDSAGSARQSYLTSVLYLGAELKKRGAMVELPQELESEIRKLTGLEKASNFTQHAKEWVKSKGLLDADSDYDGMLGKAVLRMAELFSKEGHSGMSAKYARAYFNWMCDAYDGMHTMMLNDKDFKKAKAALAKSVDAHIADLEAWLKTCATKHSDDTVLAVKRAAACNDTGELKNRLAEYIDAGVAIEPRYTGNQLIITKRGDDVSVVIHFDGELPQETDALTEACEEIKQLDGDVVLIAKEDGADGEVVVTDLVFHNESMAGMWHADRRLELETLFKPHDFDCLRIAKSSTVMHLAELDEAMRVVKHDDGSRGVVCKALTSRYDDGDAWFDMKMNRTLNVLVAKRTADKIVCAVGPLENPDEWRDTAKKGKEKYARIGEIPGKHAVKKGDVVTVDALELCFYKYADGKQGVAWTAPFIAVQKAEGKAATIADLEALGADYVEEGEAVKRWIVKSEDEQYVLAVVLEPLKGEGEHDAQNDIYSAEEIRKAFFYWTEKGRRYGFMHKQMLKPGDVALCENYLAPVDFDMGGQAVKAGTWLQGTRIHNAALWKKIKSGEITGVSIGGYATRTEAD